MISITIGEAYREASLLLGDNFEAELLLRHILNIDRAQYFARLNDILPIELYKQYHVFLARRKQNEPIQYIIEEQEFYGQKFKVSTDVLIPRPETELLIEKVLELATKTYSNKSINIADIGTGSGAIAITLAKERPNWNIYAVDISSKALKIAQENGASHKIKNIKWLNGSFVNPVISENVDIDILISNPPYISTDDLLNLESQVKDYEPRLALHGGEEGTDPYKQILKEIEMMCSKPKILAFEIGYTQGDYIKNLLEEKGYTAVIYQDLNNKDRIVMGNLNL